MLEKNEDDSGFEITKTFNPGQLKNFSKDNDGQNLEKFDLEIDAELIHEWEKCKPQNSHEKNKDKYHVC